MKIGITSDHRGYKLKEHIKKYLIKKQNEVIDYGTTNTESVDYPDYAFKLSNAVIDEEIAVGIAICGTGIGISIACNKVRGIRCAKVDNVEESKHCKIDNNANIIALNGSMPKYKALDIIDAFLKTNYTNEERHQRRLDKIKNYEEGTSDEC